MACNNRHIERRIAELSKNRSAILLTCPRQSGKDTMLKILDEKLRLETILGRKISPRCFACCSTQEEYEQKGCLGFYKRERWMKIYCAKRNGVSIECITKKRTEGAGWPLRGKDRPKYSFNNPNSVEDTAEILLKLFIEANKPRVEKAIKTTVQSSEKTMSHSA